MGFPYWPYLQRYSKFIFWLFIHLAWKGEKLVAVSWVWPKLVKFVVWCLRKCSKWSSRTISLQLFWGFAVVLPVIWEYLVVEECQSGSNCLLRYFRWCEAQALKPNNLQYSKVLWSYWQNLGHRVLAALLISYLQCCWQSPIRRP